MFSVIRDPDLSSRTAFKSAAVILEKREEEVAEPPPARPLRQKALRAALVCRPGDDPLQCSHLENPSTEEPAGCSPWGRRCGTQLSDFTGNIDRGNRNTTVVITFILH